MNAYCKPIELIRPEAIELDLLARTVGLGSIAEAEWKTSSSELRALLTAFTAGVNAQMAEAVERPPIEFDFLDYRPEPWSEVDCLAIEGEFRWYLTGRFPVIVVPELLRRQLGDIERYQAFLRAEADDESILPRGSYPPGPTPLETLGTAGDPAAMAAAFRKAVEAGREAAVAGLPAVATTAQASSPLTGFLSRT